MLGPVSVSVAVAVMTGEAEGEGVEVVEDESGEVLAVAGLGAEDGAAGEVCGRQGVQGAGGGGADDVEGEGELGEGVAGGGGGGGGVAWFGGYSYSLLDRVSE